MRSSLLPLALTALVCGIAGCATKAPKPDDELAWTQEPPQPPTNGAIFQAGREVVLAENPVAHHVGDSVTIVLNEQTAAQKSATTSTSKDTTVAMPGPTLLGKPVTIHGVPILENNINNATKLAGQGASALQLVSPLTTSLHYGVMEADGTLELRLTFDHRVLDAASVARAMTDLECVLNGEILRELRYLRAVDAA